MSFLYPALLLLILLPLLLLLRPFLSRTDTLYSIFEPKILQQLQVRSGSGEKQHYTLLLFALIFFILALARPIWHQKSHVSTPLSAAMIIALDMSASMQASDIYPNRLAFARQKIRTLLSLKPPLKIGLLLYAQDAYVAYPVTQDFAAMAELIGRLPKTLDQNNSNLFAGLEGAQHMLTAYKERYILLLSDGGEAESFEAEQHYLKVHHTTLYAIETATQKGAYTLHSTHLTQANPHFSDFIQKLSSINPRFTTGNDDIKRILQSIAKQNRHQTRLQTSVKIIELFKIPLAIAILLMLPIFITIPHRVRFLPLIALILFETTPQAKAGIFDFYTLHQAKQAYESRAYLQAAHLYSQAAPSKMRYFNQAAAYYQAGHYNQAVALFKKSLGISSPMDAKVYYNIANCFVKLKAYKNAKIYYQRSIDTFSHRQALENLAALLAYLKAQDAAHAQKKKTDTKRTGLTLERRTHDPMYRNIYHIRLEKLLPSQEQAWLKRLQNQKAPIFLRKIPATQRSADASLPW